MKSLELIGEVATRILRCAINQEDNSEGVARFLLDQLTGEQVAQICRTILARADLLPLVKIQIPRALVLHENLPEAIITDESIVHLRHAPCDRPCLILADSNDNQRQSLKDIMPLGVGELKASIQYWVEVASLGLPLSDEQLKHWQKALKGLQDEKNCSLEQFAQYIISTREQIKKEGLPLINALGWALPCLRLPRDSDYFQSIPNNKLGQAQSWRQKYQQAFSKRQCLLLKQTSSGKSIEAQDLQTAFAEIKEDIPLEIHTTIEAFIISPQGWNESTLALTQWEWEKDNINGLFSGVKTKKTDLASLTIQFYADEYPDTLTNSDQNYLQTLTKRRTKEANEEDQEFYEKHRHELETQRELKAKWDKFVFGQPIECSDFLLGLLEAFERLFNQTAHLETEKYLLVETQRKKSKAKWLELNADLGIYFCTQYRGIEHLTHPEIVWETHWLFKYDELLKETKAKAKYKKNISTARNAVEIKFYVELRAKNNQQLIAKTQLIWKGNINGLGMELKEDLERLHKYPFVLGQVARELVSKKGRLQGISLEDVATLQAAYSQNRGSLIGKYDKKSDLAVIFLNQLKKAQTENRLTSETAAIIKDAWEQFSQSYQKALSGWLSVEGIASQDLLWQAEAYHHLLDTLLKYAKGDRLRQDLIEPLMKIGCVSVDRGQPAAIIPPWHPLRLAAIAIKARQITGLLKHILTTQEVNFGDSRLFFSDLKNELTHPYYPEVCLGYRKEKPQLLAISDTFNHYSLLEIPLRHQLDPHTHENPREAVNKLLGLIKRYLELLPHKKTNISLILYECDSIRLPQALITKLAQLQEEQEEIRCQVVLRHPNLTKLSELYQQMLESSDTDSTASEDFMARLRLSMMTESPSLGEEKLVDLVFLQDVVSRNAKIVWQPSPLPQNQPEPLKHVPPRYSRKRPTAKDELKSTVYLVCPSQPLLGQTYLDTLYSIEQQTDLNLDQHFLPARQISFSEPITKKVLEEVHRLGEWVVNYDELLERKQLISQGINVIRYQQSRADERNFLVSSNSTLNLLQVLVKRRLDALNLGLEESAIVALAQKFIDEANQLSGDIVLRAAKSGKFAGELMGIVLSKVLIKSQIKTEHIGWYFLDDYAQWLGQKEEQIADILVIVPEVIENQRILRLIISEAKYTETSNLSDAKRISQKQLRDTVDRINNALFISPGRLDRDLWLSRLADLLLDGLEFNQASDISLEQWREGISSGTIPIDLVGYSHVFISNSGNNSDYSEQILIPKVASCYQEIFSRDDIRQLILAYQSEESLEPIRARLGDEKPWELSQPRYPAERVNWVSRDLEPSPQELQPDLTDNGNNNLKSIPETMQQPESLTSWVNPYLQDWIQQKNQSLSQKNPDEQWLHQTIQSLKTALMGYDLQAKVIGRRLTPNAALIRLQGSDRLNITALEKKRSELLTTHALNIISILAVPGEIVVAVARPQREVVSLTQLWNQRKINNLGGVNLSFVIGIKEIDGELLYLNLGNSFADLEQHAPHTLIAGTTGSGKSILIKNLILDICLTNAPDKVKIYLIDPKFGVDYSVIEGLPNLCQGIITEQNESIAVFENLIAEMEKRYREFKDQKVANLAVYNQKVSDSEKLPFLFVIHDEFAEWMLIDEYKDAVSNAVQRLGVKARAAGIHLIFAAQRPDANVLPMQLRDNLGNRLILRVESIGTSEIALGQKGAETLLGKGHLTAKLPGEPSLIYAQVPFLSDDDFSLVAEMMKKSDS